VLSVVAHPVTASAVAAAVLPVSVCPQLIVKAPVHKSLAGGGSVQLVHCTVVVRHEDWDPQPGVFQCANKVPVYVFANTNGVVPDATTGPLEVPERTVIKSVAILLVNLKVWPFTAPLMVEYSPAKEQVEIVTSAPTGLIVAVPNAVVFVHGPPLEQLVHCTVVVRHEDCDPQPGVFQCAYKVPVNVFANTSGVVPEATTGPLEVPE